MAGLAVRESVTGGRAGGAGSGRVPVASSVWRVRYMVLTTRQSVIRYDCAYILSSGVAATHFPVAAANALIAALASSSFVMPTVTP
jgi:hypothetical protein